MSDRRSIQDIIPPARSKPIRERVETEAEQHPAPSPKLPLKPRRARVGTSMVGMFGIALAVILVVGAAFGVVSTVFHRATVTLTPYAFPVTVAQTFTVGSDTGQLPYTTLSFDTTLSKDVASTGSTYAEDHAQGTITIYNEYSTQSQRLITNTRFETDGGLIFRIKNPVTVPGYTTKDGKKVAGSISVTVYADEAGDSYNIGAASFTIPGLAGSPQFDTMYARSTEAMSGGFVGNRAVVDQSVKDAAVNDLKTELDRTVRAGLTDKLSDDQFIVQDTMKVEFVDQPDQATDSGAKVSVKAIASAPVFSNEALAAQIASTGGVVFDSPLMISNRDALTVEAQQSSEGVVTGLVVSGDAILVAVVDTDAFLREIAGKDQGSVGGILVRYPGIKDLNLSVYPFWRQTLPSDTKRFTVVAGDE